MPWDNWLLKKRRESVRKKSRYPVKDKGINNIKPKKLLRRRLGKRNKKTPILK